MRTACVDRQPSFHDLGIWVSSGCDGSACRLVVIAIFLLAIFFPFHENSRRYVAKEKNKNHENTDSYCDEDADKIWKKCKRLYIRNVDLQNFTDTEEIFSIVTFHIMCVRLFAIWCYKHYAYRFGENPFHILIRNVWVSNSPWNTYISPFA